MVVILIVAILACVAITYWSSKQVNEFIAIRKMMVK